jgi:hypothetical protein
VRYWAIGEDPTTDSARYEFLVDPRHDLELSDRDDARLLMSSRSSQPWLPGDTIDFDFVVFAHAATGDAEMSATDSSLMLGIAEKLTSHYFAHTLGELFVRPVSETRNFQVIGRRVIVDDQEAELLDVLGRRVAVGRERGAKLEFDLSPLPSGSYYLRSGMSIYRIVR